MDYIPLNLEGAQTMTTLKHIFSFSAVPLAIILMGLLMQVGG